MARDAPRDGSLINVSETLGIQVRDARWPIHYGSRDFNYVTISSTVGTQTPHGEIGLYVTLRGAGPINPVVGPGVGVGGGGLYMGKSLGGGDIGGGGGGGGTGLPPGGGGVRLRHIHVLDRPLGQKLHRV